MGWNMKKMNGRMDEDEKVRRICRAINRRAGDREKLQTLVVRLQEMLRQDVPKQETYETRAARMNQQSEDPFDKIMVV